MPRPSAASLLFVLCCTLTCSAAFASPVYTIHDLSSILPDRPRISDMSSTGGLAGYFVAADGLEHAFRWSWAEGRIDLGIYDGGDRSGAKGINSAGWVTGYSNVAVTKDDGVHQYAHAMLWKPDGTLVHLGPLPGAESSVAMSINDLGQSLGISTFVVGDNSGLPIYENHITVWESDGSMRDLGVLLPGVNYDVQAISNSSRIMGFSYEGGARKLWLRTFTGETTYLDTTGSDWCESADLNAGENVAGTTSSSTTGMRATVWGSDGSILRTLTGIEGFTGAMGYGINNAGFVVGESNTLGSGGEDDQIRATLWTPAGEAIDLGSLPGFEISRAWGISDNGWIVGEVGTMGDWRTVVWQLVPEPSCAAGIALGVLLLVPWRRRFGGRTGRSGPSAAISPSHHPAV